jgi:hypothetical protein
MDHDLLTSLPPGYRFQPNDDEVYYYLKHWVSGKPLKPIDVVDVYEFEPWDLPSNPLLSLSLSLSLSLCFCMCVFRFKDRVVVDFGYR